MREKVIGILSTIENELTYLSREIYEHPELGNEEFRSAELHIDILSKHGFDIEKNYLDVATGFRAEYSSLRPGPAIAFLVEYDALPGIGHGCGHNMLGTVSTGAGIVLKNIVDEIGGRVVVLGTPAEETNGAKVVYADNGAFDDIDVALVAHPSKGYYKSGKSLALEAIQFSFKGKTAHAASSPDKGINALDAVIGTFNNINALREHIRSDARIHGIIKNGGEAANIVPDFAVAQFYVRATKKAYLKELVEKVKNCARGASLAMGTDLEIENYEYSYDNMETNQVLSSVFTEKLKELGCKHINEPNENYGSIDAGNVSHCCATIHPTFDIADGDDIIAHTREFADATLTDYAHEQMKLTISALVLTAVDVINNEDVLEEIKSEFKKI